MPYLKRIKRVPCPDGIPLKRIHDIKCLCGHGFKVDLGSKWEPNKIIRCPRCKTILGRTTDVVEKKWEVQ